MRNRCMNYCSLVDYNNDDDDDNKEEKEEEDNDVGLLYYYGASICKKGQLPSKMVNCFVVLVLITNCI